MIDLNDALILGGVLVALLFAALVDWLLCGLVAGITLATIGFVRAR